MNDCRCGCGKKTQKVWYPGHDAKYLHKLIKKYGGTEKVLELLELLIEQRKSK